MRIQFGYVRHSLRSRPTVLLYIALFLILIFLFDSKYLIPDSNFFINIDPKSAFSVFTHSWDSTFGFGQSVNWSAAYLFPNLVVRLLLLTVFEQRIGQSIYFALPFVIGTYAFHYLLRVLFERETDTGFANISKELVDIAYFFAGLSYVSNLYFILVFVGASSLTYAHIALPLQIGSLIQVFRNNKKTFIKNAALFSLATLIMSGTSPPYIAISFLILFCVCIYQILLLPRPEKKIINISQKIVVLLAVTILVNAIWILPLSTHFLTLNGSDNFAALSENPLMHNRKTSYLNVFRNIGLWAFGDAYQGKDFYNFSHLYLEQSTAQYAFFAGAIILACSAIFNRSRRMLSFMVLYLLSIPMVVGTNQGIFTDMYKWAYDYVPGFAIFRGSYKFVGVLILVQSMGIAYVACLFRQSRTWLIAYIGLILLLLVTNGYPLWTKRIFEKGRGIPNVPNYYVKAGKFFSLDESSYRIWLLPDQYLAFYQWGETGANVEAIWRRPLVSRLATSPQHPMNIAVNNLMLSLKEKDLNKMRELIGKYNIKYVVVRGDALWEYYPNLAVSKMQVLDVFQGYPNAQIGELKIYSVPGFVDQRIQGEQVKSFTQMSPSLYRIRLDCTIEAAQPFIKFLEKKDNGWKFYAGGGTDTLSESKNWVSQQLNYLSLFTRQQLSSLRNDTNLTDVNEWKVDVRSVLCTEGGRYIYLYYVPQFAISLGILSSVISTFTLFAYFVVSKFRENEG